MIIKSTAAVAFALATIVAPTLAEERGGVRLEDLSVERVEDAQVRISFHFQGGACDEVQPAEVGEMTDNLLPITFPVNSTAEICTMQVVEIEVDQTVEIDGDPAELAITLLGEDDTVLGNEIVALNAH